MEAGRIKLFSLYPPLASGKPRTTASYSTRDGFGLVDLWEASPVRLEDNTPYGGNRGRALPRRPVCCAAARAIRSLPRASAKNGAAVAKRFIVPSPMTAQTGRTQDGKESEHSLENTGPSRFLIVESGQGGRSTNKPLFWPTSRSGRRWRWPSKRRQIVHGWFYCAGQAERLLRSCATPSPWARIVRRGRAAIRANAGRDKG